MLIRATHEAQHHCSISRNCPRSISTRIKARFERPVFVWRVTNLNVGAGPVLLLFRPNQPIALELAVCPGFMEIAPALPVLLNCVSGRLTP